MCNKSNQEQDTNLSTAQSQLSNDQGLTQGLGSQASLTQKDSQNNPEQDSSTSAFAGLHYEQNASQSPTHNFNSSHPLLVKDHNSGYPTAGQPIVPQDGILNTPTSQFESLVFDSIGKDKTAHAQVPSRTTTLVAPGFNQLNPNTSYLDDSQLLSFMRKFVDLASSEIEQAQEQPKDSHADKFNDQLNDYLLSSLYNDTASPEGNGSYSKQKLIQELKQQDQLHLQQQQQNQTQPKSAIAPKTAFKPAPFSSYLPHTHKLSFTNVLPVQAFVGMMQVKAPSLVLTEQELQAEAALVIPHVQASRAYREVTTDEVYYQINLESYLDKTHCEHQGDFDTLSGQNLSNAYDHKKADKLNASFAQDNHDSQIEPTSVHKEDLVKSALKDPGPNLSFLAKRKLNQDSKPMISDMPRFWFNDEINETLNYIIQHHEKYNLNQQPQLLSCVGNWCYDLEEGGFFIDDTCAYLLGMHNQHRAISFEEVATLFDPQDTAKIHYNFTQFDAGNIFSDRLRLVQGPFAGTTIVAQGSAICREPITGKVLTASGFLCYEFNPQADFLFREIMGDGTFVWSAETDRTQSSPAYLAMLGYTQDEYPDTFTKFCKELVHPDDYESLIIQKLVVQTPNYGDSFETCIRLKHKDGHYMWTIGRGLVLERNEKGVATKLIGSQSNIDLIHEIFDNIGSLMFTDSLTELYNRSYFTQNAVRYEQRKNQPMTVIFVDVTGLKLTNDILGHNFGDFLIIKCVVCIKRALLKVLMRLDLFPEYRNTLKDHIETLTNKAFALVFQNNDETMHKAHVVNEQANSLHSLFNTINIPNAASFADTHKDIEPSLDLPEEVIEKLLKQKIRPEIVRLAGDELLLLFPQCPFELALQLKQEMCNTMVRMNTVDKLNFSITQLPVPLCFGIGVATVGETGEEDTFKQALERADMRMLENKEKYQEQNHKLMKDFFEQRLQREVSMRDERREAILSESERQELRAQILEQKGHHPNATNMEATSIAQSVKNCYDSISK